MHGEGMNLESILTIEQDFSVSIDFKAKTDGVYIEAADEWCGDTNSGFGALVGIDLTPEEVLKVYNFLGEWIKSHNQEIDSDLDCTDSSNKVRKVL